ncbi:MAG: hypothetical protein OHK0039_34400 [Bacteroidia bacterium]
MLLTLANIWGAGVAQPHISPGHRAGQSVSEDRHRFAPTYWHTQTSAQESSEERCEEEVRADERTLDTAGLAVIARAATCSYRSYALAVWQARRWLPLFLVFRNLRL